LRQTLESDCGSASTPLREPSQRQVAQGFAAFFNFDFDFRTAVGLMSARADADWLGPKNFLQAGESWDFFRTMQAVAPQPGWTEASEAIRHATITNELANWAGTVGWKPKTHPISIEKIDVFSLARSGFVARFVFVESPLFTCP
jgi:hypothetical protein